MKEEYYGKEAKLYQDIVYQSESFMNRIGAKFIKINNSKDILNFNIGKNLEVEKFYTVDNFIQNGEMSNNIVLKYKNTDNIFSSAEIIKAGVYLICETNLFDYEDITVEYNLFNKVIESDFEKLKLLLVDMDINIEKNEKLEVSNNEDFYFSYKIKDQVIAKAFKTVDGILFVLNIDDVISISDFRDDFAVEHTDIYIVSETNEEKMHATKIMDQQRGLGLKVLMFLDELSKDEQVNKAKESLCDWIIVVSEENLKKGLVLIIDSINSTEELVDVEDISEYVYI